MIRLGNMLPQAFLIGIMKMVDLIGPEKTCEWLEKIGEELAKTQGPGLEGVPEDDLNYLPICPFSDELIRFIDMYGERPEQFQRMVVCLAEREAADKDKVESPAVATILCLLHHAYRAKRAQMAGEETLHIACKSPMPDISPAYNEEAKQKAGVSKEKIDKLLEKSVCIFKFIKKE